MSALRIALLGAESTGKSHMALSLQQHLQTQTGLRVARVDEWLREWCDREQRTPRPDEQAAIAAEQARRIDAASQQADLVICDTTPLMTAIYSELLFNDMSLNAAALAFQQRCSLTLLMALDLPWVDDGLQRDGPQVQQPVDALLRRHLRQGGLQWSVVAGQGEARVNAALDAITPLVQPLQPPRAGLFSRLMERQSSLGEARLICEFCDVPECEHALRRSGAA
ncbi:ATP-binding protein [Paucibacter sp. APW11]|uniref:ATP-binding protein n=1 Tax=Roseateles aquae TaxID=3077235 RepID=A0ABU3P5M4_9BURK|nr:ATP-binding protein [Paucibacter sp. APW11]MDT8997873.1 ATP-binding protein [Paucibacter sp. APW11]